MKKIDIFYKNNNKEEIYLFSTSKYQYLSHALNGAKDIFKSSKHYELRNKLKEKIGERVYMDRLIAKFTEKDSREVI